MKPDDLLDALENIDDAYIKNAKMPRRPVWKTVGMIAASITLVLLLGQLSPFLRNSNSDFENQPEKESIPCSENTTPDKNLNGSEQINENDWEKLPEQENEQEKFVTLEEMNRPYKGLSIQINGNEIAILWPEEYLTMTEKTGDMIFENETYVEYGSTDELLKGDIIGKGDCKVYNSIFFRSDENFIGYQTFDVYKLQGFSEKQLVIVDIDGALCMYRNENYTPSTLGEWMDIYNLPNTVELNLFHVCEGHKEKASFSLKNDDAIWKILSDCRDVTLIDGFISNLSKTSYLSFRATAEKLGVYNMAFYVTEDGYIWTNMFLKNDIFFIGESNANKIISYALEHKTKAEYKPYEYSLAGTITEIAKDYILIDDSILCENPEDGIVFKIPTEKLTIRRYVEYQDMKVGDLVEVNYRKGIDVEAGNIVYGVSKIIRAYIGDGHHYFVPE